MSVTPKTYFLNEKHQTAGEVASGGGGGPKLAPIDWGAKGKSLEGSLKRVGQRLSQSRDPLRDKHQFLLVEPERVVVKMTTSKGIDSERAEETDFSSEAHSRSLSRLGADLLDVDDSGAALVHLTTDRFEQLSLGCARLGSLGKLQQSRWALLKSFDLPSLNHRIDNPWMLSLSKDAPVESIIELQPTLSRGPPRASKGSCGTPEANELELE